MKQFLEISDGSLYVTLRLSEVIAYKHENHLLTVFMRGGESFVLSDEDALELEKLDKELVSP